MACYNGTIFDWDTAIWKAGIWGFFVSNLRNCKIEKIAFKNVQIKYLARHITNQKLRFAIFTLRNAHKMFTEHDLYLMS